MYWFLAREVLRLRGSVSCRRGVEWSVMPDIFFYRNAEEVEADEAAAAAQREAAAAAPAAETAYLGAPVDVQNSILSANAAAFPQGAMGGVPQGQPGTEYWAPDAAGMGMGAPMMMQGGVPPMQGQGWDPSLMAAGNQFARGLQGAPQYQQ